MKFRYPFVFRWVLRRKWDTVYVRSLTWSAAILLLSSLLLVHIPNSADRPAPFLVALCSCCTLAFVCALALRPKCAPTLRAVLWVIAQSLALLVLGIMNSHILHSNDNSSSPPCAMFSCLVPAMHLLWTHLGLPIKHHVIPIVGAVVVPIVTDRSFFASPVPMAILMVAVSFSLFSNPDNLKHQEAEREEDAIPISFGLAGTSAVGTTPSSRVVSQSFESLYVESGSMAAGALKQDSSMQPQTTSPKFIDTTLYQRSPPHRHADLADPPSQDSLGPTSGEDPICGMKNSSSSSLLDAALMVHLRPLPRQPQLNRSGATAKTELMPVAPTLNLSPSHHQAMSFQSASDLNKSTSSTNLLDHDDPPPTSRLRSDDSVALHMAPPTPVTPSLLRNVLLRVASPLRPSPPPSVAENTIPAKKRVRFSSAEAISNFVSSPLSSVNSTPKGSLSATDSFTFSCSEDSSSTPVAEAVHDELPQVGPQVVSDPCCVPSTEAQTTPTISEPSVTQEESQHEEDALPSPFMMDFQLHGLVNRYLWAMEQKTASLLELEAERRHVRALKVKFGLLKVHFQEEGFSPEDVSDAEKMDAKKNPELWIDVENLPVFEDGTFVEAEGQGKHDEFYDV